MIGHCECASATNCRGCERKQQAWLVHERFYRLYTLLEQIRTVTRRAKADEID